MKRYALVFKAKEALTSSGSIMTEHDTECIVVKDKDGWVEASAYQYKPNNIPSNVRLFTVPGAKKFISKWKGHPWYYKPKDKDSYSLIDVKPIYEKILKGYTLKGESTLD